MADSGDIVAAGSSVWKMEEELGGTPSAAEKGCRSLLAAQQPKLEFLSMASSPHSKPGLGRGWRQHSGHQ